MASFISHECVNGHKRKASTICKRYENEQNGSKRSKLNNNGEV